ncbi:hypothetical protein EJ04DRAFT_586448 [Polyplosphaeria fusca]|uniref:Uncharacterized protein n=1 Tax=Polyplosphaeria fusca TaxID=682080 RepID=A0A9P4QMW7_9PLEO|nr:hypothetical protein EJ04DRAFT_586448 [Polyplosphaeria fusca]
MKRKFSNIMECTTMEAQRFIERIKCKNNISESTGAPVMGAAPSRYPTTFATPPSTPVMVATPSRHPTPLASGGRRISRRHIVCDAGAGCNMVHDRVMGGITDNAGAVFDPSVFDSSMFLDDTIQTMQRRKVTDHVGPSSASAHGQQHWHQNTAMGNITDHAGPSWASAPGQQHWNKTVQDTVMEDITDIAGPSSTSSPIQPDQYKVVPFHELPPQILAKLPVNAIDKKIVCVAYPNGTNVTTDMIPQGTSFLGVNYMDAVPDHATVPDHAILSNAGNGKEPDNGSTRPSEGNEPLHNTMHKTMMMKEKEGPDKEGGDNR